MGKKEKKETWKQNIKKTEKEGINTKNEHELRN